LSKLLGELLPEDARDLIDRASWWKYRNQAHRLCRPRWAKTGLTLTVAIASTNAKRRANDMEVPLLKCRKRSLKERAAGFDRPYCLDAIVAHRDDPVMQIDGRIDMARNEQRLVTVREFRADAAPL